MAPTPDRARGAEASPGRRRAASRSGRRVAVGRRSFTSTMAALDALAVAGAQVSVHVDDLDRGSAVLVGDDYVSLPIAGLGVVPLLVEVAAQIDQNRLDPYEVVDRTSLPAVAGPGTWQHLAAPSLPVVDLAVLAASTGDALAANALLARIGLPAVRVRLEQLGLSRSAMMDAFRDRRGPDDAPHVALGATREYARLFADLVNSRVVTPAVSAQVSEWLSHGHDLSLAASVTGLDPFAHEGDEHGLLFLNKTGRGDGVRAEAGVLAGPRAGVSYALTVCFDDLSIAHRLRAHDAFRVLGLELMEYVF